MICPSYVSSSRQTIMVFSFLHIPPLTFTKSPRSPAPGRMQRKHRTMILTIHQKLIYHEPKELTDYVEEEINFKLQCLRNISYLGEKNKSCTSVWVTLTHNRDSCRQISHFKVRSSPSLQRCNQPPWGPPSVSNSGFRHSPMGDRPSKVSEP